MSKSVDPDAIVVKVTRAAVMLDCSRQHVYQLCERGVLRRIELPGSTAIRIPVADIVAACGLEMPEVTDVGS